MKQNQIKKVLKTYESPCMARFTVQAVALLATSTISESAKDAPPEWGGELGAKPSGGFDGDVWE